MDLKKHFKLYKAGKQWCVAAIATFAVATGIMVGSAQPVQADQEIQPAQTTQVTPTPQQPRQGATDDAQKQVETPKPVDNGDYGWLDSAQVNNNNLNVSGWQATNQATDKPYRYVIAYDQTSGKELGRTPITQDQQ